jgi:monoamine oxidase
MTGSLDVAVIGGGAAGIAAARRLAQAGRSVLIVEALPRLGGRAHTVELAGLPLDMGCGWLHSAERNPLRVLADETGQLVERGEGAWRKQFRNKGASAAEQRKAWEAYEAFGEAIRAHPPASDNAGDAIARNDPWRPFIESLSSYLNGAQLDVLSVADFVAYDDAASEHNWRLPNGYGAFIARLAEGLPTALGTAATSVAHGDGVVIETDRGTIHADAAIITVSTTVLSKGAIRFEPAVDDHLHAAACLPLGLADKAYFSLATPEAVPPESHLLGRIDRARTGSYYLRPFGRPIVECFVGGALASDLETDGDAATLDFLKSELRDLLGAAFVRALAPIAVTRWGKEPTIGGSYSHALPGQAGARAVLAAPVNERLCFAGEACSRTDYSTAHGAWETGIAAAEWILDGLGGRPA